MDARALLARLPQDVVALICAHWAASVIAFAWLRYSLFRHAARPAWPAVRASLGAAWRPLFVFSGVRREWRTEPESWKDPASPAAALLAEASCGLWGGRTRRVD